MSKVFVLSHSRKFSRELGECNAGHVDTKGIGIFSSYERCLEVLEECKAKPGFIDYPNDFYIDTYAVDSMYNYEAATLLETPSEVEYDLLYALYYEVDFQDGHEDTKLLGLFSCEEKANQAKKEIIRLSPVENIAKYLSIWERALNRVGWSTGFITT